MDKVYRETYEERNPGKKGIDLALTALKVLLTNYYYHPILWVLYSTCRELYWQKMQEKDIEVIILDYWPTSDLWVGGNTDEVRDFIAVDATNTSTGHKAIVACGWGTQRKKYYDVPREWIKRLVIKEIKGEPYFYLVSFEFCCRQVLYRNTIGVVQCQSKPQR
jgi:hypothetical protein